ncbi:MAG: thioredoxin domain-containing protein [Shimia sp.]|uniref:DsbA family protein n=1 Tax=Shimia sp. TaxID=1954381 RepID=UPI003B8E8312
MSTFKTKLASSALALTLAAAPALAFDIDKLSDAERDAFRAEVRAYLLENPEVIMEAVAVLEERNAAAQATADFDLVTNNADRLFDDGYSYVGGNLEGDITIVEFVDYRCGYCRKAHDEVAELIKGDGNIRFIVKEYPILGEASDLSSRFAIAVKQKIGGEAYKLTADTLIKMRGDVNEKSLRKVAKGLGFDADLILDHMDAPEVEKEIATTRALARDLNITGTPSFVFHDEMVRGYVPLKGMQAIVKDKRG